MDVVKTEGIVKKRDRTDDRNITSSQPAQESNRRVIISPINKLLKMKYDEEIKNIVNDLLQTKKAPIKEDLENLGLIYKSFINDNQSIDVYNKKLKIPYNIDKSSPIHTIINTSDDDIKSFIETYKNIVKKICSKIYDEGVDDNFALKITEIMHTGKKYKNDFQGVLRAFGLIGTKEPIKGDDLTKLNDAMGITSREMKVNHDFNYKFEGGNFNYYLIDETFVFHYGDSVSNQHSILSLLLNETEYYRYLTFICRCLYAFDFFNELLSDQEADYYKKGNKYIGVEEITDANNKTPYASVTLGVSSGESKSKKFKARARFYYMNGISKKYNIDFANETQLVNKEESIKKNTTTTTSIASFNLNSSIDPTRILSHHQNNFDDMDYILLQELNSRNLNMQNDYLDNSTMPLYLSKDIYDILDKKRMKKVFLCDDDKKNCYDKYIIRKPDNQYLTNNYKITLNNSSYTFIAFPNRISKKVSQTKLNAILVKSALNISKKKAFVGLLDSNKYLKYRHFCLCMKYEEHGNNICIINLHLDTEIKKKIQLSEVRYLLLELIMKEHFFRNIDRFIIGGDFNADAFDVANEFIKTFKKNNMLINKYTTKILFNNIVTRNCLINTSESKGNGINLDNIILIDIIGTNHEVLKTYVGKNRGSEESIKEEQDYEKNYSDHSPIFALIPDLNIKIGSSKSSYQMYANKSFNSALITNGQNKKTIESIQRAVSLLSSNQQIEFLETFLNELNKSNNEKFKQKYKTILFNNHNKLQNPPTTGLRRLNCNVAFTKQS